MFNSLEEGILNKYNLMVKMKLFSIGLQDEGLSLTKTEKEMKKHNFIINR